MAQVLLLHHAQGLTPGVTALADRWRAAGHTVHTPDLYDGRTFESVDDGVAHARSIGFNEISRRGLANADGLPNELVYAGISLGVLPAMELAMTRAGARGAILLHGCVPRAEFGEAWPAGVPLQIHAADNDPFFVEEGGDIDAARAVVAETSDAELFLYPGDEHLFTDSSLPVYDSGATDLVVRRTLALLDGA